MLKRPNSAFDKKSGFPKALDSFVVSKLKLQLSSFIFAIVVLFSIGTAQGQTDLSLTLYTPQTCGTGNFYLYIVNGNDGGQTLPSGCQDLVFEMDGDTSGNFDPDTAYPITITSFIAISYYIQFPSNPSPGFYTGRVKCVLGNQTSNIVKFQIVAPNTTTITLTDNQILWSVNSTIGGGIYSCSNLTTASTCTLEVVEENEGFSNPTGISCLLSNGWFTNTVKSWSANLANSGITPGLKKARLVTSNPSTTSNIIYFSLTSTNQYIKCSYSSPSNLNNPWILGSNNTNPEHAYLNLTRSGGSGQPEIVNWYLSDKNGSFSNPTNVLNPLLLDI